jgi:hypothetical protein
VGSGNVSNTKTIRIGHEPLPLCFLSKLPIVSYDEPAILRWLLYLAVSLSAITHEDNQLMPYAIDLGDCDFPNDGFYRFDVYFSIRGAEALKNGYGIRNAKKGPNRSSAV